MWREFTVFSVVCLSSDVLSPPRLSVSFKRDVCDTVSSGSGMKPTNLDICGAITRNFRLPNFCRCASSRPGGTLTCSVGLQNYISIGVSAWVMPCASPANVGYRAWAGRAVPTPAPSRIFITVPKITRICAGYHAAVEREIPIERAYSIRWLPNGRCRRWCQS